LRFDFRNKLDISKIPKQVWAFYHPFYGTPNGPTGSWMGWNSPLNFGLGAGHEVKLDPSILEKLKDLTRHDPERFIGPERRDIYSLNYPILGPYDTEDRDVLRKHIEWAIKAGIDGFLFDWFAEVGNEEKSHADKSLRAMLDLIGKMDVNLKISVLYDGYCWGRYSLDGIINQLKYLYDTYHECGRWGKIDGKFAIFAYATLMSHQPSDWVKIRRTLFQDGYNMTIIAGEAFDGYPKKAPEVLNPKCGEIFEGVQYYNIGVIDDWTEEGIRKWFYLAKDFAERNDLFLALPVMPGFDGRVCHHPGRVVLRQKGKFYRMSWRVAREYNPNWILICSWNEWGESTNIEPCREFGEEYLKLTKDLANNFKKS
jgi:hypothetical protein